MFTKNVGSIDKILRIVIGAALILGALMGYGLWMWIGVIPLATALLGTCPLYTILGIRTCPLNGNNLYPAPIASSAARVSSSAGNINSMRSSDRAMSSAEPNWLIVENKLSRISPRT